MNQPKKPADTSGVKCCLVATLAVVGTCGSALWSMNEPTRAAHRAQEGIKPGMTVRELLAVPESRRGIRSVHPIGADGKPLEEVRLGPQKPDALVDAVERAVASVTTATGFRLRFSYSPLHSEYRTFEVELGSDGRVRSVTPVQYQSM